MTPDELLALADAATPGPWFRTPHTPNLHILAENANVVILCDGGQTGESIDANARLICEAPSLARDHAALLKWAERAADYIRVIDPRGRLIPYDILAEFDVLRERP